MPDREKAISALEKALSASKAVDSGFIWITVGEAKQALELLKKQKQIVRCVEDEPVTMKPYYFNYVCSGCRSEIDGEFIDYTGGKIKFCPYCGKAVKWYEMQ